MVEGGGVCIGASVGGPPSDRAACGVRAHPAAHARASRPAARHRTRLRVPVDSETFAAIRKAIVVIREAIASLIAVIRRRRRRRNARVASCAAGGAVARNRDGSRKHAAVDLNGPCVAQSDGRSVGVDVIEPAEAPLHRGFQELARRGRTGGAGSAE